MATLHKLIQRCSKGTGEAARSWGGSAVLGVSPTRALPWSPPLALCRGFPHSLLHQEVRFIFVQVLISYQLSV
ncbi:MAG: hypothetical protein F6K55_03955 [Moorea sp. SIO4A3]|nr:hypothetical protein [Moorena sp. SIO4A3]